MKSRLSSPLSNWIHFFLFLVINALLALSPFSLVSKIWVGLASLLFTVSLAHASNPPSNESAFLPVKEDRFLNLPFGLTAVFIGLGLFFRFYKVASLSNWPNPDESLFALDAIHLSRYGDWHPFYSYAQATFPYTCLLALWFKFFQPSLAGLWGFTALLSACAIPLFYFAARSFFPQRLSVLLTVLGSLAYWGLYSGRIGTTTILVPPVELAVLGLLGRSIKNPSLWRSGLLGSGIAWGFYIYPPAWLPLAFWFLALAWIQLQKDRRFLLVLAASFLATLTPLALFAGMDHYGSYLASVKGHNYSPWNFRQLLVSASYITGLFWGKIDGDFYGPYWGGLFDILTSSLAWMGIRYAWNGRRNPFWMALAVAMALSLLPGVLSTSLEFFRIFLIFPLILFLAAWGCRGLALSLKPPQRSWFLGLVLAGMAALNLYHLMGPYQAYWRNPGPSWNGYKSVENVRAFPILAEAARELGAGYVFQNFPNDMSDQSLTLASYPFNLAVNPGAEKSRARWFAVLANENYRSFLLQRFPGGRWFPLSQDMDHTDGGLGLGIFPLGSMPPGTLKAWVGANNDFGEAAYSFLNRPSGSDYSKPLEVLQASHTSMGADPFLQSCYWEKIYYLYLQNHLFGDRKTSANLEPSLNAIESAIQYGYPAAHLYNELGSYLVLMGKRTEARKAFQNALRENPAFSPAAGNLEYLNRLVSPPQ